MLIFSDSVRKLWSGASEEVIISRLNKFLSRKNVDFVEMQCEKNTENCMKESCSPSIFKLCHGSIKGFIYEVIFSEKVHRDFLGHMTRLGNFWAVFRFLLALISIASVVIFSGGANSSLRILEVSQAIGMWVIAETAFSKAILTASRYYKLVSRLGINLRSLVVSAFCSTWIEIVTLLVFSSGISLVTQGSLPSAANILWLICGILALFAFFLPLSYIVAVYSTRWTDTRFLAPPIFRLMIILTPIFGVYTSQFPQLHSILSLIPTNVAFVGILPSITTTFPLLVCATITLITIWLFWFVPQKNVQVSCWKSQRNIQIETVAHE